MDQPELLRLVGLIAKAHKGAFLVEKVYVPNYFVSCPEGHELVEVLGNLPLDDGHCLIYARSYSEVIYQHMVGQEVVGEVVYRFISPDSQRGSSGRE